MLRVVVSSAVLLAGLLPAPALGQAPLGADVSASIRSEPAEAAVGDSVRLVTGAANAGPEQATDVVLTVSLPQGLVVQAVEAEQGTCSLDPDVVCRIGPLASGASVHIRVIADITRSGLQTAGSSVTAQQPDPLPENNQAASEVLGTGESCDRVGTLEADELSAASRGSVLCGLGGDDTLLGGPRGDQLLGGAGSDALVGDSGHDRLDGGEGIDACAGDPGEGSETRCEHQVFALAEKVPLVDLGSATIGYGYHQSLFRTAISLDPFGEHVVMSSRNRGTGSTTAADIVVASRARVRAPVTGEVVAVKRYLLYCERPDWKVVIRPASDPSLRVLVLHLGRPGVEDGADVTAGVSRLGRARPADWPDSQVERYFPGRNPHVHVEVERDRASPTPGCSI